MAKQAVFLVFIGSTGDGEGVSPPKLHGKIKSIQYITDNRVPFEPTVSFKFTGETSGREILEAVGVAGRQTWEPEGTLENERIKVSITNGGKGKSGSFVVTCE